MAEVTKSILQAKPHTKILIITAFPADPLAKQALDAGAKGLVKTGFRKHTPRSIEAYRGRRFDSAMSQMHDLSAEIGFCIKRGYYRL